jgi:succinate dehydrogenase flavin-adding protein (antitoxin of CptAB toxin-antitoxin module)
VRLSKNIAPHGELNTMESYSLSYRRKMRYLVTRRSVLELELLLREFWEERGNQIEEGQLPELERILVMEDLDLLDILLGKRPIPAGYSRELFEKISAK